MFEADRIKLVGKHYRLNDTDVHWETIVKGKKDVHIQGADAIATITKEDGEYLILIKEYRYPIDSFVLGFAGGIADHHDPVQDGLREFREETGYVATPEQVELVTPLLYIDPWKSTESQTYILVKTDPAANLNPQPQLGQSEIIEPVLLKKANCLQGIKQFAHDHACKIDSRLFAYCMGLELRQRGFGST